MFVEGYKLNLDQSDDTLKTLMTHLYTMPGQERLVNALERGMNLKYLNSVSLNAADKQKILIDQKSWWEDSSTEIDLQPILKALFLQQKLRIQYIQRDGTQSDRSIAPYGLVLKYTSWYLIAFCYNRQEIRTFHCSGIKEITLLQESYSIPDDFILKSYWNFSVNAFKKSRNESEYYPVEIKVQAPYGAIFEKYDVIGINKVGASVIGMIDLHRKDIAEEEIRAFLCYGQVLYPEEMKRKAKEILESSIQMYHSKETADKE